VAKGSGVATGRGLAFTATWPKTAPSGLVPEIDHTLCRLKILVGGEAVTTYRTDHGDRGESVEVPAYHLAEWLATNWWALFHEPEKSEEDDPDFRARHWIGTARNGFALPNMWLIPNGEDIVAEVVETRISSCRLDFTKDKEWRLPVEEAVAAAARFIEATISRLNAAMLDGTALHDAWSLITKTGTNERLFCELIGALGLDPYEERPEIERVIDAAIDELGEGLTRELCEAARPERIVTILEMVRLAFAKLREGAEVDFSALPERPPFPQRAPWEAGKRAANTLRQTLGVSPDLGAGDAVLRHLAVDPEATANVAWKTEDIEVQGAIRREGSKARMALLRREASASRRFAAARALFLGWGAPSGGARLMTDAHTREQQASRAFAAEILAPIDYVRKAAGRGPISSFRIKGIAESLHVSPKVIRHQAMNHGIPLAPA